MSLDVSCQQRDIDAVTPLDAVYSEAAGSGVPTVKTTGKCKQGEYVARLGKPQGINCADINYIGVVAGGIVHDFNNIIEGISDYIALARYGIDKEHPCMIFLERAEAASKHAAVMNSRLKDLTRPYRPTKARVAVRDLVCPSVAANLQGLDVDVSVDIQGDAAFKVDQFQMGMVFDNIIVNAVQSMAGSGRLAISVGVKTLANANGLLLQPGDYVEVAFQDNGCGISQENIDRIFEPHFTTKQGGKGLGLTSALAVINEHYGQIEVESVIGKGTKVSVYIPIAYSK